MSTDEPIDLAGLVARLGDEDPVARCVAAKALGKAGPDAAAAVPNLADVLGDPDPMVRSMCAAALGKVGPQARPALDRLVALLVDPVVPVRFWAADALGRIGDLTPAARAALQRAADDEDAPAQPARTAARRALARLDRGNRP